MNPEELNKDVEIKDVVKYITKLFDPESFTIRDNWKDDPTTIGFIDKDKKNFILVRSESDKNYYVEMAIATGERKNPVVDAGFKANINLNEVIDTFKNFMKLELVKT